MNISEICIKRPVLATVLSLLLIVIGVMGLSYLNVRFLPTFESNHLMIDTAYTGASAKLVETSVTSVLEDALSGIEGVDSISSTSYQGNSQVILELNDGVDLQKIENKVRQALENSRKLMPSDVDSPVLKELGGGSSDLIDLGFVDKNMSLAAINDYLERSVKDQLSQIDGVAEVTSIGANAYTMQIRLNPNAMKSRKISVSDVKQAVQNSNLELPSGTINGYDFDYPVNTITKINTTQQFKDIVVKRVNGRIVRISDIATVKLAPKKTPQGFVRIDNQSGIMLSISATDSANPITTATKVTQYINELKKQLPGGMQVKVVYDQSVFMQDSIHEVYFSIFIAILCVLFVIYLFIGQVRSVMIPVVTIPICIFATFGIMYFCGFTINIITLLAIVLSVGLVVDDAIVVLENIQRHIEEGLKPMAAATKGAKEITFPVIAMTLTLAAVYAPVALIHGKISAIFKPFALTLAGAVIISGFVALTLSPMMCSRILNVRHTTSKFMNYLDRFFTKLAAGYQVILEKAFKKHYLVMLGVAMITAGGVYAVKEIGFTFMPQEDMGFVMGVINVPSGANINYLSKQAEGLSRLLSQSAAINAVLAFANTGKEGESAAIATLKPFDERKESAQQVSNSVNRKIKKVPGLHASVFSPSFGGSMKYQIQFAITADKNYEQLNKISQALIAKLNQSGVVKEMKSSVNFDSQQYDITVDRNLAATLGVPVNEIDMVLAAMLGGINVSTIDVDGQSYNVYLQGSSEYQNKIDDLNVLSVTNSAGAAIPLTNLVTIKPVLSQTSLTHYNRQRSATISGQFASGANLAMSVQYLKQNLPKILPSDVNYQFLGQAKNVADSQNSMFFIFILALIFIYLVLAAQFESFYDPFIILFSVPFSVIGGLIALKGVGGSINIYTIVALVTLIGLIAKHGILITQFANDLQQKGFSVRESVLKAASIRLRPILMTTAAMVFGVLPLLFASGASATSRLQIGVVLASGLLCGTFFSLVLVPVVYLYVNKLKRLAASLGKLLPKN